MHPALRPSFLRPRALFESLRDLAGRTGVWPAALPSRRGRPCRKSDPVRLVLRELERREVASETLNFLAGGLASADWSADPAPDARAAAVTQYEAPPADAKSFPLTLAVDLKTAPRARDDRSEERRVG